MNIYQYFFRSYSKNPNSSALVVNKEAYSYEKLYALSGMLSHAIEKTGSKNSFIGLLAHRSITAFSGVLGILKAGKGYVPVNPKFPVTRNKTIIDLSLIDTLVIEKDTMDACAEMLKTIERPFNIILGFDISEVNMDLLENKNLTFYKIENDASPKKYQDVNESDFAYLLFTSGSTGVPKGVPISHKNVRSYVDYMLHRYRVMPHDRFSQTFDLTFDLSVHDMFVCWSGGAALYCIPEKSIMGPAKFIIDNQLTFWFSVPSLGIFMSRFKMLKQGAFPSLKVSLFCGEPLPVSLTEIWQQTAPNSIVENIYGPTEATIGITHYRWNKEHPEKNKSLNGIVSIGKVFTSQNYKISEEGELYLSGSQITSGYWNNPEKSNEQFVTFQETSKTLWYKTGDLVKQDSEGCIYYKSRKDFQVQIRGYRVELDEINATIKTYTLEEQVVSLPFPITNGIAQSIYTFILSDCKYNENEIINYCKKHLPEYMVPKKIFYIDEIPLNLNGKVDFNKLQKFITNE